MKKILAVTGGGDCPGLNAVLRALVYAAKSHGEYEVWGSMEAFNGILTEPSEIIKLNRRRTSGIHVKGGTIIRTTNKGNPLNFPVQNADGTWTTIDRSDELVEKIKILGFEAVVNIGGDGSQKISLALAQKGLNIIGVPKTIDNDLSATDQTFGFATAVQIATDSFDKLVTTAESHHRVMIMEVMGRDAGWIALHTAIAGGAEICLIPEIPYNINTVVKKINDRYKDGKGFANVVVAEGAKAVSDAITSTLSGGIGDAHAKLGGVPNKLRSELEQNGCIGQVRATILGHVQRGGSPLAFDRILASSMGVKAFELVRDQSYGRMVSYKNHRLESVTLEEATNQYNYVSEGHYLISTARQLGISFGDD